MQVALLCVGNEFPFLCLSQRDWISETVQPIRINGKALGVLPMSRGFVLILLVARRYFRSASKPYPFSYRCKKRRRYHLGARLLWPRLPSRALRLLHTKRHRRCASGCGGAIARSSRAIACSSCAIDGGCGSGGAGSGCPDGVPLRLLPWSLRSLFAELLLKGLCRRPTFHLPLDNQPL